MTGSELVDCVLGRWQPEIGDPNLTGWATVAAYAACALLAAKVWSRRPDMPGRAFWALMVPLLVFLTVNKQIDLQSAITAAGRCLARAQGWYADRRLVQEGFLLALAGLGLAGFACGLVLLRRSLRQNALALAGLAVLATFVMMRAISFHHFDRVLGIRAFGLTANYIFENAGLFLVALNAVALLRPARDRGA